jgi:hypothetical protein
LWLLNYLVIPRLEKKTQKMKLSRYIQIPLLVHYNPESSSLAIINIKIILALNGQLDLLD